MAKTLTYRGLRFKLECSGKPQKDGRYHAKLRYVENGLDVDVNPSAATLDKLMRRIETKSAPHLYSAVLPLIAQQNKAIADELTLPIFWGLWRNEILNNPAPENTYVKKREDELYRMFDHLPNLPLRSLNLKHITTAAAMAVTGEEDTSNAAPAQMKAYKRIINLTSLAVAKAVLEEYFDDNFLREYAEGLKTPVDETTHIYNAYRQEELGSEIEAALYAYIWEELSKNGMMFGAALMLLAGLTPEEACGLQFSDVMSLKWMDAGEPVYILAVSKVRGDKGGLASPAELVSYRCIPMHRQLASLFARWKNETEQELSKAKNSDLDTAYLVRPGRRAKGGANPKSLNQLVAKLLTQLGVQPPPEIQKPGEGQIVFQKSFSRLLRRNFKYRLELDTGMTADELNYLMGRAVASTDSKHYRDWATDACMLNLKRKLDRWHIPVQGRSQPALIKTEDGFIICDTGPGAVSLNYSLTAASDGYYEFIIRSKHGANISAGLKRMV